jgi:cytochrome c biogenesis protein CcmG/thiol:disulfide interchange protein DsbE
VTAKPPPGVNWTVLVVGLAIVLPLVALFAVSFGNDPHAVPNMLEGQRAPSFQLVDLDGKPWSLEALRGKPVVLNFWSTWCGPCKQEHQILQDGARRHPEVTFLGVVYNDEPDACRRYLEKAGTSYAHLVDADGRVAIDYGVAGVPETYFIDATGTIAHKQVGPVNGPILEQLVSHLGGGR